MVTHKVFYKENLLSKTDFDNLVLHKETIINQGKGCTTIHEDGSVTIDTSLTTGDSNNREPKWYEYSVSKEAIFNYTYNIDMFLPYLGEPFINALYAKYQMLVENGVNNPKPYMARAYRNNQTTEWHMHTKPDHVKHSKFWVTIYYLHPNWDIQYDGAIEIGMLPTEPVGKFNCLSNSMVAHNGYYGHGVNNLKFGYEGDRDILIAHWISE